LNNRGGYFKFSSRLASPIRFEELFEFLQTKGEILVNFLKIFKALTFLGVLAVTSAAGAETVTFTNNWCAKKKCDVYLWGNVFLAYGRTIDIDVPEDMEDVRIDVFYDGLPYKPLSVEVDGVVFESISGEEYSSPLLSHLPSRGTVFPYSLLKGRNLELTTDRVVKLTSKE
jgi:hypothetical protein